MASPVSPQGFAEAIAVNEGVISAIGSNDEIDARTPDPLNGRIERQPDGAPSGTLHESAMALVARHLPSISREEMSAALRAALKTLHGHGITHWQDACVGDAGEIGVVDSYDAYRSAALEGWLTARVRGALWWDRSKGLEQVAFLLGRREAAPAGPFRATSVAKSTWPFSARTSWRFRRRRSATRPST